MSVGGDDTNSSVLREVAHSRDEDFTTYWDLQKTVPFFLVILMAPLIHFKSANFFNKFNAVGEFIRFKYENVSMRECDML